MIVRDIYLEPDEPLAGELVAGIANALREFMAFHGSGKLVIEHTEPESLDALLLEELGLAGS
jgi:hypothetical protein